MTTAKGVTHHLKKKLYMLKPPLSQGMAVLPDSPCEVATEELERHTQKRRPRRGKDEFDEEQHEYADESIVMAMPP
jgi:hypothetical protein